MTQKHNSLPKGGGLPTGGKNLPQGKSEHLKRGGGLRSGGGMKGIVDDDNEWDDGFFEYIHDKNAKAASDAKLAEQVKEFNDKQDEDKKDDEKNNGENSNTTPQKNTKPARLNKSQQKKKKNDSIKVVNDAQLQVMKVKVEGGEEDVVHDATAPFEPVKLDKVLTNWNIPDYIKWVKDTRQKLDVNKIDDPNKKKGITNKSVQELRTLVASYKKMVKDLNADGVITHGLK